MKHHETFVLFLINNKTFGKEEKKSKFGTDYKYERVTNIILYNKLYEYQWRVNSKTFFGQNSLADLYDFTVRTVF